MDELAKAKKALANALASPDTPEDEVRELELYVADLEQGKGKTASVTVEGISPEQYNRMYGVVPGAVLGHPVGKYVKDVMEGTQKAAEARRNIVPEIPATAEGVPTSRVDRILYGTLEDGSSSLARQEGQHILQQQLAERAKEGQQTIEQLARQGVPGVDPKIIARSPNLVPTNRGILTTVEQAQELEKAPTTMAGKAKQMSQGAKDLWKGIQYAGSKGWGPVIGHTLGGVALGTDIIDTINRAKAEDPTGAIISGIGALGSGMSFIPGYGLIGMGLGAGAPALNYLRDEIRKGNIGQGAVQTHENMNPAGDTYATGGLVHLNGGGMPNVNVSAQTPPNMTGQPGVGYMNMPPAVMARLQLEQELQNKARLRAGATGMGMAIPNQQGVKTMPGNVEAGVNVPVGPGHLDVSGFRSINPITTPIQQGGHMFGGNVRYTIPFQKGGAVKKFAAGDLVESTGEAEDAPSLADAASGIYRSFTNPEHWEQVALGLNRTRKAIPGVAESVVRGGVAAIPGVVGDIESLGREGINAFQTNLGKLSGTDQGTVSPTTVAPTTRDILNYVPRITPTHEGAQTVEDVGSFIGPAIGGLALDVAKLLPKNVPAGLSIKDVTPPQRLLAPKNELGAYSALEEAALNLKQNKGTADQLYNMLLKEPGVKQEELQYRGLDALLKGKNEPMTKEGILAHLQENKLPSIKEHKLGDKYAGEREPDYDTAIDNFHDDWRNAELDDDAMNAEYSYRRYDDTDWHDERKREYMEERGLDEEAFEADPAHKENVDRILDQDAQASAEDYGPYVIEHRNHDYRIRGNNWGDIELIGPEGHIDDYQSIDEARQAAASHALDYGYLEPEYYDDPIGSAQYGGGNLVGRGNGNYEEQLFHYDNPNARFNSSHFGEGNLNENLLMHMRRQDAENPQGKKIFKIEEQQSDWHQKGREHGYKDPQDYKRLNEIEKELDDIHKKAKPYFEKNEDSPQELIEKKVALSEEREAIERKFRNASPDAPLKKNWNEFLMKKALHDAAMGDYDKLAWTTGKTQADRYGKMLADNVSEIQYTKTPDNRYIIAFKRPGETSYTPYQNGIGENALGELFGEHIADQMKNNLGETIPYLEHNPEGTAVLHEMGTSGYHFRTPQNLETFTGFGSSPEEAKADLIKTIPRLADKYVIKGENLSFGSGRGMVGFYDKMQGDFLNKFLKKYGEKVHTDHVLGGADAEEVNAVNITPEMRKDLIEKGFPFFKKGGLVTLKKKK